MSEEDVALVLDEAKEAMEKSIRSFRIDLQKVRTGRANPAILDGVQVDYYGTPTPLNQLANLSAPDPRLIVISPYDKGALGEIERAILKADLGLTPTNDGKLVRIPIPALTEERRQQLVKQIKKSAEHHKVGVREARRGGGLAAQGSRVGRIGARGRAPPSREGDPGPHRQQDQEARRDDGEEGRGDPTGLTHGGGQHPSGGDSAPHRRHHGR